MAYEKAPADSRAAVDVVIGDARLSIERELRDGTGVHAYDVLAIDAFSGDAIPVHLLTREAFARYREALAPDGVLAVHVSNQYLDLRPVVRGLSKELGERVLEIESQDDTELGLDSATWMLVSANAAFLDAAAPLAQPEPAGARSVVWTDAFSSLLAVMKRSEKE
jgi:spermidine synthase